MLARGLQRRKLAGGGGVTPTWLDWDFENVGSLTDAVQSVVLELGGTASIDASGLQIPDTTSWARTVLDAATGGWQIADYQPWSVLIDAVEPANNGHSIITGLGEVSIKTLGLLAPAELYASGAASTYYITPDQRYRFLVTSDNAQSINFYADGQAAGTGTTTRHFCASNTIAYLGSYITGTSRECTIYRVSVWNTELSSAEAIALTSLS